MMSHSVLVIEDEETLRAALQYNLSREGYRVFTAADGGQGVSLARDQHPDVIVLDLMLPVLHGLEVCRLLRREMTTPILMLTAKDEVVDKVVGLEMGADDYMTKPFSMQELKARVRALVRRLERAPATEGAATKLTAGDLTLDLEAHSTSIRGSDLELKPKEFELLAFLMANRGRALTRDQLLDNVWGYDYAGDTRTVDVHVRWLRSKIEADPGSPKRIITVRGTGYRFEG